MIFFIFDGGIAKNAWRYLYALGSISKVSKKLKGFSKGDYFPLHSLLASNRPQKQPNNNLCNIIKKFSIRGIWLKIMFTDGP